MALLVRLPTSAEAPTVAVFMKI